ncbi:MAG TPA: acyl-CoA dehydrogenase [Spirochaetia bacterium]|nr:acyl-CoA dehydrogenase [Spirochaetia bacterium]
MIHLTPAQKMVRDIVREITEKEFKPRAEEIDKEHRFPQENMDLLKELGFYGLTVPKQYGGIGGDYLSYIIALEEIARYCATTCVALSAHTSLTAGPILKYGTEEQKQKFLVPLATGKAFGAFGLTEPNAGTDAAAQQTTAVLDGNEWVINGSKVFITNAAKADIYVIFAMTDKSAGVKGISAFILPADTKGFSIGKIEEKLGISGSSTGELIFENVRIPKDYLLGGIGKGFGIAMQTLDGGRVGIAAQALGIAQGALDESIKYIKERDQFGKPISRNQGLQWYVAEMATRIEASRHLIYTAARMKEMNLPYGKESAMAKWYASETATFVTHKAIQLFGGYGYTRDYPVERMYRDARITEIYEGTSEVQKMVIAANIIK